MTVSVVFVLVRVLVRTHIQRQFALDDYLLVLAICCFSMMTGFIVYAIDAGGFGQVSGKIPLDVLIRGSKYLVFAQLFNVLTQTITNLSIAVLQLRISGGVYVTFKRVHYASIALNVCAGLAQFFFLLFRCYPVSKAWTPTMKGGNCTNEDAIAIRGYVFCACNVILTWYYALAPIHLVGKLQLRLSVKLSSIFVLSVGILASIAQIMKFKYLLGFSNAPNPLKAFTPLAIFCWIELCLAISAASISTFRPLFKFMPGCATERPPKYPPTVDTEPKMRLRRGYTFQLSEIDSMSIKHDELHITETFDLENPIPTALTTPGPVEETRRLGYFDEYTSPGAGKTKGRPLPDLEKGM